MKIIRERTARDHSSTLACFFLAMHDLSYVTGLDMHLVEGNWLEGKDCGGVSTLTTGNLASTEINIKRYKE